MSKKETVEVVIDSNEAMQKPKLVEVLALHEDIEDYDIEPLDNGDFIIDNCMFERKTPSDFASSLQEGRLRDQVERMAGCEEVPFILIEGDMKDFDHLEHTDIPSKSLRGMDASIELRNNISVKYCSKIELLADVAVRLARKEKEEVTTVQTHQTDAVKDTTFLERVFLAIDGIGPKTAETLSGQFENLSAVIECDKEDLENVEGIGTETSKEILKSLHGEDIPTQNEAEQESKVYNI